MIPLTGPHTGRPGSPASMMGCARVEPSARSWSPGWKSRAKPGRIGNPQAGWGAGSSRILQGFSDRLWKNRNRAVTAAGLTRYTPLTGGAA